MSNDNEKEKSKYYDGPGGNIGPGAGDGTAGPLESYDDNDGGTAGGVGPEMLGYSYPTYDGPDGGGCGSGNGGPAPISNTYNDSSGPFPIGFKDHEENEFAQKPSWFRQAYNWVKNAHKPDPNKSAAPECPRYLHDAGSDFNGPGFD